MWVSFWKGWLCSMKKILLVVLCVVLAVSFVGCGEESLEKYIEDSNIKNIAGDVYGGVDIGQSFEWDEKTDEEKMELAEYVIEWVKADMSEDDEIMFVYGHYGNYPNTRDIFKYDEDLYSGITIDEDAIAMESIEREARRTADNAKYQDSSIKEYSDGTGTMYNVTMASNWNTMDFYDQGVAAQAAVEKCKAKASTDGVQNYSVQGVLSDGSIAFMWDGANQINLWVDGLPKDTYTME